jgi:hypothetical protein
MENTTENIVDNPSINNENTSNNNRFNAEKKQQTVSVNVNTEKTSVLIFLLCFFIPFLAPIIALIRGKFLFLLAI